MKKDDGYIMVEIILITAMLSLTVSIVATANFNMLNLWNETNHRIELSRERLIGLEMVINLIENARAVKDVKENELILLTAAGSWEPLYYKSGVGLCWKSDSNIITRQITGLNFKLVASSLLIVEVIIKNGQRTKKLRTGLEI